MKQAVLTILALLVILPAAHGGSLFSTSCGAAQTCYAGADSVSWLQLTSGDPSLGQEVSGPQIAMSALNSVGVTVTNVPYNPDTDPAAMGVYETCASCAIGGAVQRGDVELTSYYITSPSTFPVPGGNDPSITGAGPMTLNFSGSPVAEIGFQIDGGPLTPETDGGTTYNFTISFYDSTGLAGTETGEEYNVGQQDDSAPFFGWDCTDGSCGAGGAVTQIVISNSFVSADAACGPDQNQACGPYNNNIFGIDTLTLDEGPSAPDDSSGTVPEPGTLLMLGTGMLMAGRRIRVHSKSSRRCSSSHLTT